MSVLLREGIYGKYFGNDYNSSNPLQIFQMERNAEYIYSSLSASGWTLNSIAGILGNMETESSINPGRWQNDRVGGSPEGHGYGLVQWTPYTKYTEWAPVTNDPSTMDNNLKRINWEVENNAQWISTNEYPFSFNEFKTSNSTPEYLAQAFLKNYERPANPNQPNRSIQARKWYNYLSGFVPPTPGKKANRKFKFVLYTKKLRDKYN